MVRAGSASAASSLAAHHAFEELLHCRLSIDEELASSERAVFSPLLNVMLDADPDAARQIEAWMKPYRELHALRLNVWQSALVATYASARNTASGTQHLATALMELLPPRNLTLTTEGLVHAFASELMQWRRWDRSNISQHPGCTDATRGAVRPAFESRA